jgi:hypothetical protein
MDTAVRDGRVDVSKEGGGWDKTINSKGPVAILKKKQKQTLLLVQSCLLGCTAV